MTATYVHRDAEGADLPAIVEIYNHAVATRECSCDLNPTTVEARRESFSKHTPQHRPLWVAEARDAPVRGGGGVIGYLGFFHFMNERPGDFITADLAIYLHPAHQNKGLGTHANDTQVEQAAMVKPVMNLADAEFDDIEDNGLYTSKRASIGRHIGARDLGYNLTELPPGKAQCPFHSHRGEEEMFFILEGEGELRFGDERHPLRAHDVVACPTGGPEVAHQIINTGTTTMRYLAISTMVDIEACEYPDSQKVLVSAGGHGRSRLRGLFRAENTVEYYDREKT